MTDYLRDPNRVAPCSGYEASDERFEANQIAIRRHPAYDDSYLVGKGISFVDQIPSPVVIPDGYIDLGFTTDDGDLPGMWSRSDFEGGDPDERSYAERGWTVPWKDPAPITIEFRLDAEDYLETLQLLIGDPTLGLVPLCEQEIPGRGQE